jgi:putative SOS response-associated peptidase YedK
LPRSQCFAIRSRSGAASSLPSGYYEWQNTPSGKQPYYFTRRDGQIITIAGLWSKWTDKATGTDLHSCTMVVTEPNKLAAEVHDRMPVILEAKDFEQWERGDVKDASMLSYEGLAIGGSPGRRRGVAWQIYKLCQGRYVDT